MTPRRHPLACVAMAIVLLAGCTGPGPEQQTSPPAPTASESTDPAPDWTYTTPTPEPEESDAAQADSLIDEEADQDARDGAAAAATVTAEIWVQGSALEQREWQERLMETLTPIAQDSYRDRWWGYRVAETELTGEPEIVTATMVSATVTIPTNAGDLTLTLTRPTPTDQWLTSGIQPATTEQ
ncbi:hypothetical protein [Brachybacterium paraconglomeratum]|uniref:hypothetical protein n=1 Tax=Brachybacterium paraconglomeratum TaxID=173362 RepID=UPI002492EC98|nr:hypothetical protein [Brachybacterium paraconglomeratum]